MTKVHQIFPCDVFYPMQTFNTLRPRFRELQICNEHPYQLGQIISDDGDVKISFHVYELNNQ